VGVVRWVPHGVTHSRGGGKGVAYATILRKVFKRGKIKNTKMKKRAIDNVFWCFGKIGLYTEDATTGWETLNSGVF
jgi:hypothetical protein